MICCFICSRPNCATLTGIFQCDHVGTAMHHGSTSQTTGRCRNWSRSASSLAKLRSNNREKENGTKAQGSEWGSPGQHRATLKALYERRACLP
eukprot:s3700_g1.t1